MTATIPPTSGHKNQDTIADTSDTTARLLVGGLYIIMGAAYCIAFGGTAMETGAGRTIICGLGCAPPPVGIQAAPSQSQRPSGEITDAHFWPSQNRLRSGDS